MVRLKLMIMRDLVYFMILVGILMASSAVVAHAIVYPDYPFGQEMFLRIFNWGFFSLFLTDLSGWWWTLVPNCANATVDSFAVDEW